MAQRPEQVGQKALLFVRLGDGERLQVQPALEHVGGTNAQAPVALLVGPGRVALARVGHRTGQVKGPHGRAALPGALHRYGREGLGALRAAAQPGDRLGAVQRIQPGRAVILEQARRDPLGHGMRRLHLQVGVGQLGAARPQAHQRGQARSGAHRHQVAPLRDIVAQLPSLALVERRLGQDDRVVPGEGRVGQVSEAPHLAGVQALGPQDLGQVGAEGVRGPL